MSKRALCWRLWEPGEVSLRRDLIQRRVKDEAERPAFTAALVMVPCTGSTNMNISRGEQRVLHVLARGGQIRHLRGEDGRIHHIDCFTHEGFVLSDCTLAIFAGLRRKRLIESREGGPYRISRLGRLGVRSQADNR